MARARERTLSLASARAHTRTFTIGHRRDTYILFGYASALTYSVSSDDALMCGFVVVVAVTRQYILCVCVYFFLSLQIETIKRKKGSQEDDGEQYLSAPTRRNSTHEINNNSNRRAQHRLAQFIFAREKSAINTTAAHVSLDKKEFQCITLSDWAIERHDHSILPFEARSYQSTKCTAPYSNTYRLMEAECFHFE